MHNLRLDLRFGFSFLRIALFQRLGRLKFALSLSLAVLLFPIMILDKSFNLIVGFDFVSFFHVSQSLFLLANIFIEDRLDLVNVVLNLVFALFFDFRISRTIHIALKGVYLPFIET